MTIVDLDKTDQIYIASDNIIFNLSPDIEILVNAYHSSNFTLYQEFIDINELYRCDCYSNLSVKQWADISLREKINILKNSKSLNSKEIKLERINFREIHSDNCFPNSFLKLKLDSQIVKLFSIPTDSAIGYNELKYFYNKEIFDIKLLVLFFLYIFAQKLTIKI